MFAQQPQQLFQHGAAHRRGLRLVPEVVHFVGAGLQVIEVASVAILECRHAVGLRDDGSHPHRAGEAQVGALLALFDQLPVRPDARACPCAPTSALPCTPLGAAMFARCRMDAARSIELTRSERTIGAASQGPDASRQMNGSPIRPW